MSTSFREAYALLQKNANLLRNQSEPNIDELLGLVTESVEAYKVCKERIDAVEEALAQALANSGTGLDQVRPSQVGADQDEEDDAQA